MTSNSIPNFKSLSIERKTWGEDEGKLVANLSLHSSKNTVSLKLPDKVAEQILILAKSAIIDAVEESANEFIFELTTSIPETLKLSNT